MDLLRDDGGGLALLLSDVVSDEEARSSDLSALRGKPKLFLVQACRKGERSMLLTTAQLTLIMLGAFTLDLLNLWLELELLRVDESGVFVDPVLAEDLRARTRERAASALEVQ